MKRLILLIVIIMLPAALLSQTEPTKISEEVGVIFTDSRGTRAASWDSTAGNECLSIEEKVNTKVIDFTDEKIELVSVYLIQIGDFNNWNCIFKFIFPAGKYTIMQDDSGRYYFRHEFDFDESGDVGLSDLGRFSEKYINPPNSDTESNLKVLIQVFGKGYYTWEGTKD